MQEATHIIVQCGVDLGFVCNAQEYNLAEMIPGGSNDKRLTDADSIGTTSFVPTLVILASCRCCLQQCSYTCTMVNL